MYPVLLDIGPVKIYSWGFMLAIAVLVAILGISKIFEKEGYDPEHVLDIVLLLVITGLLGSRLAFIFMYQWHDFLNNPLIFVGWGEGGFSGLVWYGGFTASMVAFIVYNRYRGYSFWKMADIFTPFLALAYSIVRIGCFLNGCCYGKATDSACSVVFPLVDSLSRYPTQLYSSALNLMLFIFLLWRYPHRKFSGQILAFYMMGYGMYRFIIEFYRENTLFIGPFSVSQAYSLLILAVGIILYMWRRHASTEEGD